MATPKFGRVQLRIMQVIWDKGRVNARQITDALNQEKPIAHSTVQTLLRKLEAKGAINHEVEERTFVFYPLVKPEKVKRSATRELINHMFEGSPAGLVAYLLKNERISKKELRQIHDFIDNEEK